MREYMRMAFTLAFICLISAVLLTVVFQLTQPVIAAREEAERQARIERLFPTAEWAEDREAEGYTATMVFTEEDDFLGLIAEGRIAGYSGIIRFTLGINNKGEILDVAIVRHSETVGIGTKIVEESFREQFYGLTAEDSFQRVDIITGATVSSQAMKEGVKETLVNVTILFLQDELEEVVDQVSFIVEERAGVRG